MNDVNQENITEQTPPSNLDSDIVFGTKTSKKLYFAYVLIFLLFLTVIGLLMFVFLQNNNFVNKKNNLDTGKTTNNNQVIENSDTTDTVKCIADEYQNTTNLNVLDSKKVISDKSEKIAFFAKADLKKLADLVGETNYIKNADTSGDYRYLTYIIGQKDDYNKDNAGFLEKVYLYDIENQTRNEIYQLTLMFASNGDKRSSLTDVKFSPDRKLIAIATTYDVILYDIVKNTLTPLLGVSPNLENAKRNDVFSYYSPRFSFNNKYLSLKLGYYEGGSDVVYDLTTKKDTGIKYSSYVGGTTILGWIDDQLVIGTYGYDETDSKGFYLVSDPYNSEKTTLLGASGENISYTFNLFDKDIYYVSLLSSPTKATRCDFYGELVSIESNIQVLNKLNIQTKQKVKLIDVDATSESVGAYYTIRDIIQTQINGKDEIVLYIQDSRDQDFVNPLYYVLGERDNKTSLEKLDF